MSLKENYHHFRVPVVALKQTFHTFQMNSAEEAMAVKNFVKSNYDLIENLLNDTWNPRCIDGLLLSTSQIEATLIISGYVVL